MTDTEFNNKLDYFNNLLGRKQVTIDEARKWGFVRAAAVVNLPAMKKAFIYLSTLSRYQPESSNSINQQQAEQIFTQLEKLLV